MKTTHKPVCLGCDNADFSEVLAQVEQEYRGEMLLVPARLLRCTCGHETMLAEHVQPLRVATADAYRAKHGLLTSGEIRALRERAGLSQRKFAETLQVGAASIPRWESWQVQEPVYDQKLRAFAAGLSEDTPNWMHGLHSVGGFSRALPAGEAMHAGVDWWKLDMGAITWRPDLGIGDAGVSRPGATAVCAQTTS